jgi:hypothetical protein
VIPVGKGREVEGVGFEMMRNPALVEMMMMMMIDGKGRKKRRRGGEGEGMG